MPRKKIEPRQPIFGRAAQQRDDALRAQLMALYALARFGWLTRHQIQQIFAHQYRANGPVGPHLALRTLQRAFDRKLVDRVLLPDSPGGQMVAWVLTQRGMKLAVRHYGERIRVQRTLPRNSQTKQFDLGDPSRDYHRFLSNQFLIDFSQGKILSGVQVRDFWPEHELGRESAALTAHWGYVPDALVIYRNDDEDDDEPEGDKKDRKKNILLICEVENSLRGQVSHGKKLTHWLHPYAERQQREGQFTDSFSSYGRLYEFRDVTMVFLSSNEKIFRNIYRKINQIFTASPDGVFHLVMKDRRWTDPLADADLLYHDYQGGESADFLCIDTAQRVADGQAKRGHEGASDTPELVLLALGRFGWLTSAQIQDFLQFRGRQLSQRAVLRTLERASADGLIVRVPLPKSPGRNLLAWVLTAQGLASVPEGIRNRQIFRPDPDTRRWDLGDPKTHYRRFLGNQFVLDVLLGRILPDARVDDFWPAHEADSTFVQSVGCVPDGVLLVDGQTVVVASSGAEIGYFGGLGVSGTFTAYGQHVNYQQVQVVFVSARETIFRSIYRAVEVAQPVIQGEIFHLVLQRRSWTALCADLLTQAAAAQRVADGEARQRISRKGVKFT